MARKKEQAFRTITEVSDWLDTPSHVLRFWESRFTQIKPVKRAGGRRYCRRESLKIVGGMEYLLQGKGTGIAAVKELFKCNGEQHIKEYSIEPIFPEKVPRKSKNIRKKISHNIQSVDINNAAIENYKRFNNQSSNFEKLKKLPDLSDNDILRIEELYFQLKRIRNRMKRRLDEI